MDYIIGICQGRLQSRLVCIAYAKTISEVEMYKSRKPLIQPLHGSEPEDIIKFKRQCTIDRHRHAHNGPLLKALRRACWQSKWI